MTAERGAPGTWQHLAYWDHGSIALGRTAAEMPASDAAAARLVAAEFPGWLHYAADSGQWYVWDGRCHAPDHRGMLTRLVLDWSDRAEQVFTRARQQVNARLALDGHEPGAAMKRAFDAEWEPWAAAAKYASRLKSNAGRTALESYLAGLCSVPDSDLTPRDPDLISVANGTLNLRTGRLGPHDPADMMTSCLSAAYRPEAQCPGFLALLHGLCGRDASVTWYLARLLGYCLLGDNREQVAIFIDGPTGNGKSTVLHVVAEVLGDLAHRSQPALITVTKHGRNARVENSIRRRRLVTITETGEHMSIEESQLKRLTGERVMAVDQHYAKTELRTPVSWTIVVATNQMPNLTNFDEAIRRRVIVVPAGPTIPRDQVNPHLADEILASERDGILALLAAACRWYFAAGLDMPPAVQAMTSRYAAEQDTVAAFLADCCQFSANGSSLAASAVWHGYQEWSRGGPRLGRNEFYARLGDHPGVNRNEGQRRFEGLEWTDQMRSDMAGY